MKITVDLEDQKSIFNAYAIIYSRERSPSDNVEPACCITCVVRAHFRNNEMLLSIIITRQVRRKSFHAEKCRENENTDRIFS